MGARLKLKYDFANNPDLAGGNPGPDLTLTRTTTATMKDADGYLRTVQAGEARFPGARWSQNICLQSEDFSTTWNTSLGVVTADQAIAPDGTLTGDKITDDSSTGTGEVFAYQIFFALSPSTTYTMSVYLKADQLSWARVRMAALGALQISAFFDLANGVVGATVGADVTSTFMKDVGGGWYRCGITFLSDAVDVNAQFWVQPADGDNDSAVDLDGTSSIFAWGAQLEEASGAWDSENLLLQSEDFLTTWLETNAASVANQTVAPDGTLTADKLIDDSSTGIGLVRLRQIVTTEVSTAYTYSMYLKADQLSWALLQCSGMGTQTLHMYVNLSTGTVGSVSGDVDDSGVENVGNGWYRCWIAFTSDAVDTSANFNIFPANVAGDINVDHDGTSSIFVWGAQLERKKPAQTGPGPYIQTTGVAITNYSPSSYIPTTTTAATSLLGTNDGLLIEEARTNRCLQSENLSSSWVNTASVDTQGETIAPDGSLTGNKLVDDGSTGTKDVRVAQSVTVATATAYTFSLFAKADQLDIVALQLFGFTTPGTSEAWFDLGAGTVGTVDAGFDNSGIEDYGNGWYRCWGSFTTDAADTTGTLHIVVCETDGVTTVTADGTSSIFVWGVQLEAGEFPTSYIPTTTASVTRNVDDVLTTDASWYNADESTIYSEAALAGSLGDIRGVLALSNGTVSERIIPYADSSGAVRFLAVTAGGNNAGISGAALYDPAGTYVKHATGLALNDVESYANGQRMGTGDTSYDPPSGISELRIGNSYNPTTEHLNGLVKEIRYYDTRLDNATLEAMSSGVFPDLTGLTTQRKDAGAMWYNRMKAQREADLERFNKMMDAIHRR